MNEYIKVSLHNHFGKNKAEYRLDRKWNDEIEFDYIDSLRKLKDANKNDFRLLSFTNHNVFLLKEYLLLRLYARELDIELLPGIEISLKDETSDKYLHVVVVFEDSLNILDLHNKVEALYGDNINNNNDNRYLYIGQLVELLLEKRAVIIPHGKKQGVRSIEKNIHHVAELKSTDDFYPVIIEDNTSIQRQKLETSLKKKLSAEHYEWVSSKESISALDQKDSFSEIDEPTFLWGENNFNDLYYGSIINSQRLLRKNQIISKGDYISKIEIIPKNKNSEISYSNLNCSHGLNSIIGTSGSGKTLLLNWIYKSITEKNMGQKTSSIHNEYDSLYDQAELKLYDSKGNTINQDRIKDFGVFVGENLYTKILDLYGKDKSQILRLMNLDIDDTAFKNRISEINKNINSEIIRRKTVRKGESEVNNLLQKILVNNHFLQANTIDNASFSLEFLNSAKVTDNISSLEVKLALVIDEENSVDNRFKGILSLLDKYNLKNEATQLNEIKIKLKREIANKRFELNKNIYKLKMDLLVKNMINSMIDEVISLIGNKAIEISKAKKDNSDMDVSLLTLIKENIILQESKNVISCADIVDKSRDLFDIKSKDKTKVNLDIITKEILVNKDNLIDFFPNIFGTRQSTSKIGISKYSLTQDIDITSIEDMEKLISEFERIVLEDSELNIKFDLSDDYKTYFDVIINIITENGTKKNIENLSAGELSAFYIENILDSEIKKIPSRNKIIFFDQPDVSLGKEFIHNVLGTKIKDLRSKYQVFMTTHEPLLVINSDSNRIFMAENSKKIGKDNEIGYSNISVINDNLTSIDNLVDTISNCIDGGVEAVKLRNKVYGGLKKWK